MRQQEEEVARERNFVTLLQTAQQSLIPNQEAFDCGICFVPVEPEEGVVLRECLHRFCRSAVFKCYACLYTFTRQLTFVSFYDVQEVMGVVELHLVHVMCRVTKSPRQLFGLKTAQRREAKNLSVGVVLFSPLPVFKP